MKTPATCEYCKKPYFKHLHDAEHICSGCQVDEALHSYLGSLRRKDGSLSFFEWLILQLKG